MYFDKDLYPIDIGEEYTDKLREFGKKFGSRHIQDVRSVSFTEYKEEDGSTTIYLLDINWWENSGASCTLCVGGRRYPISLDGNRMRVVRISNDEKIALMYSSADISVSKVSSEEVHLKGCGKIELTYFKNGSARIVELEDCRILKL